MVKEEKIVRTWMEIAKYTPFQEVTLRKVYGQELKDANVVFMARVGKNRTLTACAYPNVIKRYCALRKWRRY